MAIDPYHIDDLAALIHEQEWSGTEGWLEEEEEITPASVSAKKSRSEKYLVAPVDLYLPDSARFATYGEAVEAAKEESWNDCAIGVWHPTDDSEEEYDLLAIVWQQRVYRLWSE